MIPAGVEVFVATTPVDLRYGFERLAGIATEQLGRNARSGALFVFFGKRRTSVKVLFADRTGLCIFYKRLDRGTFRIPEQLDPTATHVAVAERALDDLLEGVDIELAVPARTRRVH
jgi:transposase